MPETSNAELVLTILKAVEDRDIATLQARYHPEVQFNWPAALPYGGRHQGAEVTRMTETFRDTWGPLQPTEAEQRMTPEVVAAEDDHVVVRYTWRGRDSQGRTLAADTLADYQVRDGKLARATMYHFDLDQVLAFLRDARA